MIQSAELRTIQYLRGIAALMVVHFHFLLPLKRHGSGVLELDRFRIGDAGVDIFFVISGLIMVITTASKAVSPGEFFRKRIHRIVPAYWFYTALMVIAMLVVPDLLHTAKFDPVHVLKSLFFIPAYHPVVTTSIFPALVQGWTLNYEMFFYLLFAVALLIPALGPRVLALIAVLAALVTAGLTFTFTSPVARTWTSQLLLEFAAGCLLGYLWMRRRTWFQMPLWLIGLLVAVAIGMFALANGIWYWTGHRVLSIGIPAALLVVAALGLERTARVPEIRWLHNLGDSSYSIYLCHTFVVSGLGVIWARIPASSAILDLCAWLAALAGSALVGYWSWRLLEVRSLRLLRGVR